MLKAKALCAVSENVIQEIKPLVSEMEVKSVDAVADPGLYSMIKNSPNIVIESVGHDESIPESVMALAVLMTKNNELIKDVLTQMRQLYHQESKELRMSLADQSEADRRKIVSIIQEMAGLLSSVRYFSEQKIITATVPNTVNGQQFIQGQYLELGIYMSIKEVLEDLAAQYHKEYKLYRNVRLATVEGKIKAEFDVVIEFNDVVYVVECKSGKNFDDYETFRKIGELYGIVPDRLLLVDTHIEDQTASNVEYFHHYYVCNLKGNSLYTKVFNMISKDMMK